MQSKKGDLVHQIEVLKEQAQKEKLEICIVYKDIGSKINTTRKGLSRLIQGVRIG